MTNWESLRSIKENREGKGRQTKLDWESEREGGRKYVQWLSKVTLKLGEIFVKLIWDKKA